MLNLLEPFFEYYNVKRIDAEKYLFELEQIILLTLLATSQNRINEKTEQSILEKLKNNNFDSIVETIARHYNQSEWGELLKNDINPIVDSYFKEVLFAKH